MATKKPVEEQFQQQDFDLFAALEALDRKDYGWYGRLTEEQQRKFVPYMLLHWMSAIKGNGVLPAYYLLSTDANANKYMFNEYVGKHPELQWMMLCASSPGTGKQFHQWIPHLSAAISALREKAKERDVLEYFKKVYKGADEAVVKEFSAEYTRVQNHKLRLAKIYPELKLDDIEVLAASVTSQDIDEYERLCGG